ncbi:hypothetical protein [Pseudoalteromonas fuliginea]|uniref:Uncharacterized protein n=1 Tax=Pseudoalteromonas fuliginea TaxID=1872678 RepID=A0ABQ6RN15_9GAMM|nr:hypothetical protein [Pseudoalteromonas fuliginea]KAA1165503.1 hypothetical protein EU509_01090 [Pseudoalteromonas fuliginea]KAA1169580.1 hypothetical protein EUZ79_01190 [Pseudoalteromonas fuliginea]
MTVYQIKNEAYTYDVIDFNIVELSKLLSKHSGLEPDTILTMFMSAARHNIEFSHLWPQGLNFDYFGKAKKQDYDISRLGHFLIMKMPVYELLKARLANIGEFLPVKAEGNNMILFNLLTFGQEQKDMCLTKYEDGFEDGLELLTFEQDDIQSKLLFKSKLEGAQKVYCTDEFKNIIQSNKLKGLVFDEDLLDPFV